MLHHVSLGTNDVQRARRFYDPLLAALGLRLVGEDEEGLGYGATDMFFSLQRPSDGEPATVGNGVHVCFQARDRATVDAFHRIALENGGRDEGAPGIRAAYDAHYYGAFVRDLDGNKIEAVTYAAT